MRACKLEDEEEEEEEEEAEEEEEEEAEEEEITFIRIFVLKEFCFYENKFLQLQRPTILTT